MPLDYIALWGLATAAGFVFRPIVEHLALKTAEDFAKDFIKGCFKSVLKPEQVEAFTVAAGLAIKNFLQIMQEELEGAGYRDAELAALIEPLELFIKDREVQNVLGPALIRHDAPLDSIGLVTAWRELHMPPLPQDFSWSRVLKRYQKAATGIRRDTPALREVLDAQLLESIAGDVRSNVSVGPDEDLTRYQRAMQRRYAYLKLESLDPTTYDLQRLRLDRLFIPQDVRECNEFLPQVFELPKEFQKRLRALDHLEGKDYEQREIERYRKAYLKKAPQSVTDLLQKQRYRLLVILGDPGSGKSSLLQWHVLRWADQTVAAAEESVVPVLIELEEYARNRREGTASDFLEFLHKGTGIPARLDQHAIAERLTSGSASLVFDGLDEVFDPELRRAVITDIARFANDYPRAHFAVTSRVIGYKPQALRDAGFEHFMLQDLSAKQIDEFLVRWHAAAYSDPAEGEAKRLSLKAALSESPAIAELAGNPLLLTMMAILNRTQDLPRDRAELYNQCSRLLLYQWKADDALRADGRFKGISLDFKDKLAMLRRVAGQMQASEAGLAGNLIEEQPLEDTLASVLQEIGIQQARQLARAVIDHLRTRNFILCFVGGAYYSFVHRTFLEYFCASDFLWQFKEERSLEFESLKNEVFGVRWRDETWHEVLCLICGMLVPRLAGEIITFLLQVDGGREGDGAVLLAARCYSEVRNKAEIAAIATSLLERLQKVVERMPPGKKEVAAVLDLPEGTVERAHLAAIARGKSEETSRTRQRRLYALRQLGTYWRDDTSVYQWLIHLAKEPTEPAMRDAVFRELADSWGDTQETFDFFLNSARFDTKPIVRLAALSHLLRRWPDAPATLDVVVKTATADTDASVRVRAIQSVGAATGYTTKTRDLINDLLEEDLRRPGQPSPIRKVCFQQLSKFSGLDDRTLSIAKLGASSNSGSKVKKKVINLLKRRTDDPEVPSLLLSIAQSAESIRKLQRFAEQSLKEVWPNSPEAASLIESDTAPQNAGNDAKEKPVDIP